MPKNALFLLKNRKNRRALQTPLPPAAQTSQQPPLMTNSWLRAWQQVPYN